jgi:hypothetical protein
VLAVSASDRLLMIVLAPTRVKHPLSLTPGAAQFVTKLRQVDYHRFTALYAAAKRIEMNGWKP